MSNKLIFCIDSVTLGQGEPYFAWQHSDSLVAVCGSSNIVHIFDRQGKKFLELPLPESRRVKSLDWDKDGEVLAVLQESLPSVIVWNINTKSCTQLEVGANDRASFIKWSKTQSVLAVGSEKGSLVFYNKSTQRKIPVVGKHSAKVITGDWNTDDLLVTGGEDKTLTISTMNGDTKMQGSTVKSPPIALTCGSPELVTMIIENKCILLYYTTSSVMKPLELTFQSSYGRILYYAWYQSDKMVVGCSEGWVLSISTHVSEMGSQLNASKMFNVTLDALCVCTALSKAAIAGDNMIKVINLSNFKESRNDRVEVPYEDGRITAMHWTGDGQILSVATTAGKMLNFLMIVPSLYTCYGTIAGMLTGLTEVSLVDCTNGVRTVNVVVLETEPSVMALGPNHLAVAINTSVWYYKWKEGREVITSGVCVRKRDYRGSVKQIVINQNWTASLSDGVCSLHLIESDDSSAEKHFPEDRDVHIVYIAMSPLLLFLADTGNKLRVYHLVEQNIVSEIRLESPIEAIYPNFNGTRVVARDVTGGASLCIPVSEKRIAIPNFSSSVLKVLWDFTDHNMFLAVEPDKVVGYLYSPVTLTGASVEPIRELLSVEDLESTLRESVTFLDKAQKPLLVTNGILYCHSESQGSVKGNSISSHTYLAQWRGRSDSTEGHYKFFLQNLALNRFKQCLLPAERLGGVKVPELLGKTTLKSLDLEVAEKAFHLSKNVGMVYAIRSVKHESEKQILLGHVSMMLSNYDQAQNFYMKSSQPTLALELRSDLQDWLIALQLARAISPAEEPVISKKLALQLESLGSHSDALKLFERAASSMEHADLTPEELSVNTTQSYAGIARNSIRTGDISRGYKIALEINDPGLKVECAQICEQLKHFTEAAQLYQRGGQPERAASLYIKLKKWKDAAELMDVITTPKLLIQLGKAKENEGNFKDAEETYLKANDYESVIRLCLGPLDNPEKARALIQSKCPTQAASSMMAAYYEKQGDKQNAIKYLIHAEKKEDAFVMAQSAGLMEVYAQIVLEKDPKNTEEHMRIAQYLEGRNQFGLAARHYESAGNLQKSLSLYMHAGEEFYSEAIKMAARSNSDAICMQLDDFLMGEMDGIPKDPIFIYELNVAMGKLKEAAHTVVIIASEEQEAGNYKSAHDKLYKTMREMRENQLRVPLLLQNKLMVLHSYILVKRYVQLQNHLRAARLLTRVAKNISQFPSHTVQILTSTVIECIRAGLREAAYTWACVLVRPEYRSQLDEKYKKQIEKVAIKRPKTVDPDEDSSQCPFCSSYIFEDDLRCGSCKNSIPFCIASGKHMVLSEWSACPACQFPAMISEFSAVLERDNSCPMCAATVNLNSLTLIPDPVSELRDFMPAEDEQ